METSTPLLVLDRSSKHKISKDIAELNNTLNKLDAIDIYRLSTEQQQNIHSTQAYTKHSTKQTTFWAVKHTTKHNKFKRPEIMQSMFSNYNGINLEIINRKIAGKPLNIWKLNNILLDNPQVKEV